MLRASAFQRSRRWVLFLLFRSAPGREQKQRQGIVPHRLGWKSSYEELLLACSIAQCQGRRCRGMVAAGPWPDGTSGSPWMPTHPGHAAGGLGPAQGMEISAQAMLRPPRV